MSMSTCKLLMPYVFGLLICLALVGLLINRYFYKKLKTEYPEIYESLGKPSVFLNNSIKNSLLVNKFILLRKYKNLPDKKFKTFCDFKIVYGFLIWAVFIILLIMTFFC